MSATFHGRFALWEKIGAGSFGEIYKGQDMETGGMVAVKLESAVITHPQLQREARIYRLLNREIGISKMYWFGSEKGYNVMAMQLLGLSLEKRFEENRKKLSLKTVLMIAEQSISLLETLHKRGMIHRDIKPENFCFGGEDSPNQLYLIDFGLAKPYLDSNGAHHPVTYGHSLTGTARYASVRALQGVEQSRRDDLESLAYSLIYLLKGSLPWQGLREQDQRMRMQKILELKCSITPAQLCAGLPQAFTSFVQSVKRLGYDEEPKYAEYRSIFRDLFIIEGFTYDYVYDWGKATPVKRGAIRHVASTESAPVLKEGTHLPPLKETSEVKNRGVTASYLVPPDEETREIEIEDGVFAPVKQRRRRQGMLKASASKPYLLTNIGKSTRLGQVGLSVERRLAIQQNRSSSSSLLKLRTTELVNQPVRVSSKRLNGVSITSDFTNSVLFSQSDLKLDNL